MSRWPMVPLKRLCTQDRRQWDGTTPLRYIGLEHVSSGTGEIADASHGGNEANGTAFVFDTRHVLYGKLRPYLNKVAEPSFSGRCSTELIPLLPAPDVERGFLAAIMRHPRIVAEASGKNTGSRMPRADMNVLFGIPVPLPPLEEQRRIVDVLNRAAGIRRLREAALAKARDTIPALFLSMFGDPATNPKGWPQFGLEDLVEDATRKATKIEARSYQPSGRFPIIDQGQTEIAGYCDEDVGPFSSPLPAVVFGDHTRRFKLAQVPFFLGADGAKLLLPKSGQLDAVFLFAQLSSLTLPNHGYSRHFKFLKATTLTLPPLALQQEFAARLADLRGIIAQAERALALARETERALMARLLG